MADLTVKLGNLKFTNPVLPAAGPNVMRLEQMLEAVERGAGGIVTKTVSREPAVYPKPCISKGPCDGLLNCETWSDRPWRSYIDDYVKVKETGVPLICSIGYSPEDVAELGKALAAEVGPDVVEFSTHYVGKTLDPLKRVAEALRGSVSCPVWMKVSPSTPDIPEMAKVMSDYVDGFVAVNSVGPALDFDIDNPRPRLGTEDGHGWLSGPAITGVALYAVYQISHSQDKPVVGVGGIRTGEDAVKFIMAGASLVGICSEAIRRGTGIYGKIASEISDWMDRKGYGSLDDIRGLYAPVEAGDSR
ncbi:diguanylate cyclase [Dethiosulfovibrio sp. F2B]|uniref:dihydroorotate dehydrogenase n=1 Tax=Dethiosulfovibrio faecalis TaxID=2720018 RepID=UPI001F3D3CAE|nr:diguanylate cyclase [Dethiosulfovibrio faecalis]MCF4151174.1 diguanylate cyclase [Dethiosulfovibrio faecalis]